MTIRPLLGILLVRPITVGLVLGNGQSVRFSGSDLACWLPSLRRVAAAHHGPAHGAALAVAARLTQAGRRPSR